MSFIGAGFLAGLLGIVLPLAIHLFARRKRVNLPWGAMRFLAEAKPDWKRRSLRLQDWLVLLLRVAAVALLALAFARPALKSPALRADGHELLLLVDGSPSTELRPENGASLKENIYRHATEVLEHLPPDSRVRLFVNGTSLGLRNLPPTSGKPFNETRNRTDWLQELKSIRPGADTLDWSDAIREALNEPFTVKAGFPNPAEIRPASQHVLVIADAARHGWPFADAELDKKTLNPDEELPAAVAWTRLAAEANGSSIFLLPVGADFPQRKLANLCIDRIETDQLLGTPGKPVTFRATVSNRGAASSLPVISRWTESATSTSVTEASIPALDPGAIHEVVLQKAFPEAGPKALRLEIEVADALASDNAASTVFEVVDQIRVAAVVDRAPNQLKDPDTLFSCWTLAAAAGDPGSVKTGSNANAETPADDEEGDSIFQIQWLTPDQLANTGLDEFALVVWLANNSSSTTAGRLAEKLRPFVSDGGGLWFRPHFETNPDTFNRTFFPHEFGLSPAGLAPARAAAASLGLRPIQEDRDDPFKKNAFSALTELRVKRHLAIRDPLPPSSLVLAEFEGGSPFVVSRRLGRGQVILTALDSHPQSGNLAACVGYVSFVRELLWRLASTGSPRRNFLPNESEPWNSIGNQDRFRAPDGDWTAGGQTSTTPGLYWIESSVDGSFEPFALANIPEESGIRPVSKTYLDRLHQIDGIRTLNPDELAEAVNFRGQPSPLNREEAPRDVQYDREIWAWLLAGLLGFLMMEVILAHQLLMRRRSASGRSNLKTAR